MKTALKPQDLEFHPGIPETCSDVDLLEVYITEKREGKRKRNKQSKEAQMMNEAIFFLQLSELQVYFLRNM